MVNVGDTQKSLRGNHQEWRLCSTCGCGFWSTNGKFDICFSCFNSPGATYQDKRGARYIKLNPSDPYYAMTPRNFLCFGVGWTSVARYTMAQKLGRCLDESEYVRHINKNLSDNNPANLVLFKRTICPSNDNEPI